MTELVEAILSFLGVLIFAPYAARFGMWAAGKKYIGDDEILRDRKK